MKIVKISLVNGLNKTKGVERAPDEILKELKEIHSNDQGKEVKFESDSVEITGDLVKDNEVIYEKVFDEFEGKRVLFLGGDHSTSYSLTRAFFDFCENKGGEPCLIVFDAHLDMMKPVDKKIPTHEEWLRALIEDGFKMENILLVGVRNSDPSELKFMGEGVRRVSVEELMFGLENKTDAIMEFGHGKEVYVSIDIDCVDPAHAPGTGYCESGGISSRELIYIVKRMNKMKNLRAVDLVEINPSKDEGGRTVRLGAKIVSELI